MECPSQIISTVHVSFLNPAFNGRRSTWCRNLGLIKFAISFYLFTAKLCLCYGRSHLSTTILNIHRIIRRSYFNFLMQILSLPSWGRGEGIIPFIYPFPEHGNCFLFLSISRCPVRSCSGGPIRHPGRPSTKLAVGEENQTVPLRELWIPSLPELTRRNDWELWRLHVLQYCHYTGLGQNDDDEDEDGWRQTGGNRIREQTHYGEHR